MHGTRAAAERHHLFPRAHLERQGVRDLRDINQIANYALAEWNDNADIGDRPPAEYLPALRARVGPDELERTYYWHALPDGWETMAYGNFLQRRRELMARVIRDAYGLLRPERVGVEAAAEIPLEAICGGGESLTVEFKATLRTNLHTGQRDPRMELAILKTIAGFLNLHGGTLIVGVADDGSPLGLDADGFANDDATNLHLVNLVRDRVGPQYMMYIHPRFEDLDHHRVFVIDCRPARSPVYVREGTVERFYVRTGAATTELTASQTQAFIEQRFR